MTKNERVQMNNLSKLVYGSSSKWQKLVEKGDLVEEKRTKEDGTEYRVKVYKRWTPEECKKIMEEIWAEEQAEMKKKEEEAQLKALEDNKNV